MFPFHLSLNESKRTCMQSTGSVHHGPHYFASASTEPINELPYCFMLSQTFDSNTWQRNQAKFVEENLSDMLFICKLALKSTKTENWRSTNYALTVVAIHLMHVALDVRNFCLDILFSSSDSSPDKFSGTTFESSVAKVLIHSVRCKGHSPDLVKWRIVSGPRSKEGWKTKNILDPKVPSCHYWPLCVTFSFNFWFNCFKCVKCIFTFYDCKKAYFSD